MNSFFISILSAISLAYLIIPFALIYYVRRIRDHLRESNELNSDIIHTLNCILAEMRGEPTLRPRRPNTKTQMKTPSPMDMPEDEDPDENFENPLSEYIAFLGDKFKDNRQQHK